MAIRYDKKLNQEIDRTIKNFNQKIARLEKQERQLLPSKISKKQLKESVYTRRELQRKLKELQRFSRRGAEDIIETKGGVKLTKYELDRIKRENTRIKRNLSREINRKTKEKPKVFGKKQASTFSEMGEQEFLNLVSRRNAINKDIEKLNEKELQRLVKLLEKTSTKKKYMDNIFKENYFEMFAVLGYYYGYDADKLNEIKDKLYKLRSDKFLKLFNEERAIKAILDYYPIVTENFDMNSGLYVDRMDYQEDVTNLYDAIYENLDDILQGY